ncbi:class I SAM-dependent methyltransferase [Candidatus Woesearchaeota archaeon]|nr:MAG: class I SAM-dependent methyltransferase [Candidatus Woesearchaeota archaeon]
MAGDYYSELGEGYLQLHKEEQAEKFRILAELIKPGKNDKMLDVGCGPGWAEEFFSCQYQGIDPAKELVRMNPKCREGRGEELPYSDGTFDIIICVSAIHNMDEPNKALDEMARVAKKNARIGITVLRKSRKAADIIESIRRRFDIIKIVEHRHDTILLCKR